MKILRLIGLLLILSPILWAQNDDAYFGEEGSEFAMDEDPQALEVENRNNALMNDPELYEIEDSDPYWSEIEPEEEVVIVDDSNLVRGEDPARMSTPAPALSTTPVAQPAPVTPVVETKREDPLAEAYYAVGEQYEKRGKRKGASYKERARRMSPDVKSSEASKTAPINLSPRSRAEQESNLTAEVTTSTSISQKPAQDEATQTKIIRLQFNRFVRGMLSENLSVLENLLAPVVELNGQELEKSDLLASFELTFESVNLAESTFKDLYTTEAKDLPVTLDDEGGVVKLEAQEREDLQGLPFWKTNQEFHFSLQDGKWLLTKIVAEN